MLLIILNAVADCFRLNVIRKTTIMYDLTNNKYFNILCSDLSIEVESCMQTIFSAQPLYLYKKRYKAIYINNLRRLGF